MGLRDDVKEYTQLLNQATNATRALADEQLAFLNPEEGVSLVDQIVDALRNPPEPIRPIEPTLQEQLRRQGG